MTRTSEGLVSGASCTAILGDFTHLSNNCSQVPGNRDRLGSKAKDVQGKDAEKVQRKGTQVSPDETDWGCWKTQPKHDYEARGDQEQAGPPRNHCNGGDTCWFFFNV